MQIAMRTVIVLLAWLFFGGLPGFAAAYLPVIGPGSLRFLPEPPPPAASVVAPSPPAIPVAPPPAAILAPADEEDDFDEFVGTSLGTNVVTVVAQSPSMPGSETNASFSLFTPPGNDPITPQVLLHYFHQRFGETNDPAAGVTVPLMFIPPQSDGGPRPSSKVIYSSP